MYIEGQGRCLTSVKIVKEKMLKPSCEVVRLRNLPANDHKSRDREEESVHGFDQIGIKVKKF